MIVKLITYTVPNGLSLGRNAFSMMTLHNNLGTAGLERPFQSFEKLKGPKWRWP